jgi:4a-hydroxytetrahydrobiopterin dehydratase
MLHCTQGTRMNKLEGQALQHALSHIPRWAFNAQAHAIERSWVFNDFVDAFGFMTRVALAAEQRNHHPNWSNVYNRVTVQLSTHDAGGLTDKDIDLARWMDTLDN